MILELFDVVAWLNDRGITIHREGKNISKGQIGIQCPFCGDHAYSGNNHLGIDIDTNTFHCWICAVGKRKSILSLIVKIDQCSYKTAEKTVEQFSRGMIQRPTESTDRPQVTRLEIPQFDLPIDWYLTDRGFDAKYLIKKYHLSHGGPVGKFKHRLIIPFLHNGKPVTFTGRALFDDIEPKYKNFPDEKSIIPINHLIYGSQFINDRCLLMEGPTDVWNIGDGAGGIIGKSVTPKQIEILSQYHSVFILLDADANDVKVDVGMTQPEQIAHLLTPHCNHVEILELDSDDPGSMSDSDKKSLRNMVFGKMY